MAIYKLKDLCIEKPIYGKSLIPLKVGKYKYFRQMDITSKNPTVFVNETKNRIMRKNDFFISRVGTILPYFHEKSEEWVHSDNIVKYVLNKNMILSKYLFYYFSSKIGQLELQVNQNTGSVTPVLHPPIALNLRVICPSLKEQQKIIDIIEPHKHLFEKYHNCIRIDSFENTKKDLQKIIDIIEPIEQMINVWKKMSKTLENFIKFLPTESKNKYFEELITKEKNKPKNINQISAKVLKKRSSSIENLEKKGTYSTNSFFCPKKTLIINSIRTYLEKFAILPCDADINGTLFSYKIKNHHISLLRYLLNDNFWKQCNKLSVGTKMPILKERDLLKFKIPLIKPIFENKTFYDILTIINLIIMKLKIIKKLQIQLLIK